MNKIEKLKMPKEEVYERIKEHLKLEKYDVSEFNEIQFGLQFSVSKDGSDIGMLRIFESKKKGTSVDLSQIDGAEMRESLLQLINSVINGNESSKVRLPQTFFLGEDMKPIIESKIAKKFFGRIKKIKPSQYQDYSYKINSTTISQFKSGKLLIQGKNSTLSDDIYNTIKDSYEEKSSEALINAASREIEKKSDSKRLREIENFKFDLNKYVDDDLFRFLYPNDKIDLRDGIVLLEWTLKEKIPFKNYSILIRNFSIVFEGFLIKTLIRLGLINGDDYKENVQNGTVGTYVTIQKDGESQFSRAFKTKYIRKYSHLTTKLDSHWKEFRNEPLHSDSESPYNVENAEKAERKIHEILDTAKEVFDVFKEQLNQENLNIFSGEYNSHIGTDECGKGDFFGPLVVAGVFVDSSKTERKLRALNVRDSKTLSDNQNLAIAEKIMEICKGKYDIVPISPAAYNNLYADMKNLNKLLAWGHARAIENILTSVECNSAISDQFGDESLILDVLMKKGKKISLEQHPKAEEDVAVAAASILARAEFLNRLNKMSIEYGMKFPKGASTLVEATGREFVKKHGKEKLKEVAKIHFKTTENVLKD